MKTAEYLDAAKDRLLLSSDYQLAKAAGVPKGQLSEIRAGKRGVPLAFAYWLAETLDADPAVVVADLESQWEKNPDRAEFWRSFVQSHLGKAAAWVMGIATAALIGNAKPSYASDTLNVSLVSESQSQSGFAGGQIHTIYIMRTLLAWLSRTVGAVRSSFSAGLPRFGFGYS